MTTTTIDSLLRNAEEAREVKSGGALDLLLRTLASQVDTTRSIITWGAGTLDLPAAPRRLWPGSSSAPADPLLIAWIAPCAGVLNGLTYRCLAGGDVGVPITFRFVKNGIPATGIGNPQLVVPAQDTFAQEFIGQLPIAAGDVIALECVKPGPLAVAPTSVVMASSFLRV